MSQSKRFKRWSPKGRRLAWARNRANVERLEDRVLLSAEPMVQQSRPELEESIEAANVTLEIGARQSDLPTIDDFSAGATRIDLTRGATQNAQLASGGGKLLELNNPLASLIIDLGAGDDQVQLSQQSDGRLKLSGGSDLYELVFAKPTSVLAIRGLDGVDRLRSTASRSMPHRSWSRANPSRLRAGNRSPLAAMCSCGPRTGWRPTSSMIPRS